MKNKICFILLINFLILTITFGQSESNSFSNNIIEKEQVRFSILTPELIRLEWNENNDFVNDPSFTFINRDIQSVKFTIEVVNNRLIITTSKLKLIYKLGSGKFNKSNLSIISQDENFYFDWHPSKKDTANLRGTTRTLDGWNGGSPDKLEKGLLSKDGWVLIDDSKSFLFDSSDWNWVKTRKLDNSIDWYFFGYGRDYKKCLNDYTTFAGKIPLPPKYAFGNWWSKYWIYSDYDVRKLIKEFQTYDIPLDVFIIDMDWHYTFDLNWKKTNRDPFGEPVGWTGYTWNKNLFPSPEALLKLKETNHIKTALNLHPASGVSPMEEQYETFFNEYKPNISNGEYIPYKMTDKNFAKTYFTKLLKPLENIGVDFWWLDWQQWPYSKNIDSLSNTWWLNYTFFSNMEKTGKRPLLFHRWGGLGNHRYQIGFSGDAIISWKSLDFQPYFTSTASNVGYGYWSHDLGGHIPMGIKTDPELYLRWLQFGVFSPIFRTHSTKSRLIERKIWKFPNHFDAMKDAIKLRYTFAPYIYKSARETYDTGISLCKPLYYEHPFNENAYNFKNIYYFGKDIIAAPVTSKIKNSNDFVYHNLWLPEGEWFEYQSGSYLNGDKTYKRKYLIDEIPFFIRTGSIIPMYEEVKNLSSPNENYTLYIVPGEKANTFIYDDDQSTSKYKIDEFSKTEIKTGYPNENTIVIYISETIGDYAGKLDSTQYTIKLPNTYPPKEIIQTINNKSKNIKCKYSGYDLETVIKCDKISIKDETKLTIKFNNNIKKTAHKLSSIKGYFHRLRNVLNEFKYTAGGEFAIPDSLYYLEQTPTRIDYNPSTIKKEIEQFIYKYKRLEFDLKNIDIGNKEIIQNGIRNLYYKQSTEEKTYFTNYRLKIQKLKETIHYIIPYSEKYTGGGKTALFDDQYGTQNYLDLAWQGAEKQDMELVIDLEKNKKINSISINALQNILYWIFFPHKFEFEISNDNINFIKCGELFNNISPQKKEILINTFKYDFNNCFGRYLKVKIKNIGVCPDWHHGKGGDAWIFLDEISIK